MNHKFIWIAVIGLCFPLIASCHPIPNCEPTEDPWVDTDGDEEFDYDERMIQQYDFHTGKFIGPDLRCDPCKPLGHCDACIEHVSDSPDNIMDIEHILVRIKLNLEDEGFQEIGTNIDSHYIIEYKSEASNPDKLQTEMEIVLDTYLREIKKGWKDYYPLQIQVGGYGKGDIRYFNCEKGWIKEHLSGEISFQELSDRVLFG